MRQFDERTETGGFSFAELAIAMLILVIGAVLLLNHLSINYMSTATERDRVFAYSKAQAILSEVQSFADRGTLEVPIDLDALDDGIINKSPLTIQTDSQGNLVLPDHVVSGNYRRDGDWIWSRRITVRPFAGLDNRNVRYVTVRIFRRDKNGIERSMADLSAVINSAGGAFPTTQVFDVYLLAIENIPGWWVFMDSIKPFVESMINDLENRNPGLQFRTHWITKASFGRNQGYRPYTNDQTDSYAPIPGVYHYPGRMPAGSASIYYYVPENIRGHINVDGVDRNGYDPLNPQPYALADFFNHGMRYPDEFAFWQARVKAVEKREAEIEDDVAAGNPPRPPLTDMSKEPTLRLLLEDMCTAPQKHKNSLFINLHGELLPMPALRNYSDAARDPETPANLGLRVVTHPEELRTARSAPTTDALNLRVYAYNTDNTVVGVTPAPIAIEVVGMRLADNNTGRLVSCTLTNVPGGIQLIGGTNQYTTTWQIAKHRTDAHLANEMYYDAAFVTRPATPSSPGEAFTRILLYNTPVAVPAVNQVGGVYGLSTGNVTLKKQSYLYQLAYVPSPVTATAGVPTFERDLTRPGNGPKNTARWVLSINPSAFNGSFVEANGAVIPNKNDDAMLPIRTRIWNNTAAVSDLLFSSGIMWPAPVQPENLSTTYAWWADNKEDVPFTERAQFNGDPRHEPYKDCFNGATVDYPSAFNWYHDNLNNNSESSITDYTSIAASAATSPLRNRWQSGLSCDVPRYMELMRTALVRSACVYTTLTGWSYYYLGIGQDIGYDSANGYPNSIPSNMTPHGAPGTNGFIDTIRGERRFARAAGANYWWDMPWPGELYPDSQYAAMWRTNGNLTPGTSAGQYYQGTVNSVYTGSTGTAGRQAYGTAILNYGQRTRDFGCTSFFNIGTASSTFHHQSSNGNGTLTPIGVELANNYNMAMPSSALISRPFGLNWNGGTGDEFSLAPYSTNRHSATLYKTYYTHPQGSGSGLVKLVDPGNTSAAYIVVNGIDNTVASGTTFIAKFAVLSLVHSFFEAGSTTNSLRIPQLPRFEIESPTDITELVGPSFIQIQYAISWKRWDGLPYTATGSFAEDELQLEYVPMYSRDGGRTFRHIQDDTEATPGIRPAPAYIVPDSGVGPETFDWPVPALSFPEGSYVLRIDCFRRGAAVHYSYHQTKIYIQR